MKLVRQLLLITVLASVIGFITYSVVTKYVVRKAEENLQNIILSHRSFHHYIQQVMHPAYYKAKDAGKVAEDFYAPEILSSSFIARVMHGYFNQERSKAGLSPVYYKLAADNPRNRLNQADEQEKALIRRFNENRALKDHTELVTMEGKKYLLYAKPFLENNHACLLCHGKRTDAPVGLQHLYPGEGGFNESTGRVRAIESIRVPLNDEFTAAFIATTVSLSVGGILIGLYLFNVRLRLRVKEQTAELEKEIEERRKIQEALKASEENYRHFTSLTSDYVHKCLREGDGPYRIQWLAGAIQNISGYSAEEILEKGCWMSIVHPDDRSATASALADLNPGESREIIFRITTKDQHLRWISEKCRCQAGPVEGTLQLLGAATDITERREAEEMLHYTRVSVDAASDAIFWIAPDGHFVDVNNAACSSLGYSREELLRMGVCDVDPFSSEDVFQRQFPELRRQGMLRFESAHRTKDGRVFPVEIVANYVRRGEEERNCAFVRDISKRRELEVALRRSEELFRSIVESSPVGMHFYRLDDGNLIFTGGNPAAGRVLGTPQQDMVGKPLTSVFPNLAQTHLPEMSRQVAEGALDHQRFEIAYRDDRVDGTFDIQVYRTGPGAIVVDFMDVSERKRAEEERLALEKQLLHTQKLESLGVLAGGIAHDFNNILTSIVGNTDLALMRLNPESPVRDNLQRIEKAATRAADLAKQMLAYSGKGKFVIESISLNRLVEEMTHLLEVSISKKAILRFNFAKELPSVEGDATQLRQIIMNLVINASEAIGDKSGVIAISTGCMQCDRRYLSSAWLDENMPEGVYAWLEVADTGCGMDRDTASKIFDPFFSTKFTGRGLGMAAVLGIVRGHKGAIKLYSEPGRGTTFKVLLPAGGMPKEIFDTSVGEHQGWKGSGTVLLADDEETVIGIGSEMLKELGFKVLSAMDGKEALELFSEHQEEISCVILDLTMPHLDGEQCFRELRLISPDVKVIMSSGYNEQEVTRRFAGKGLSGFIQKPYKLSDLRDCIRNI